MRLSNILLCMAIVAVPTSSFAQSATDGCDEGFEKSDDVCVPVGVLPGVDGLGLPTGVAITNFAPAALPIAAGIGAAIVAGAAGSNGSNSTNGTNGTN